MCKHTVRVSRVRRLHGLVQGQEHIFSEVRGLVSGVMNGINACVLAYGRRGSGKAHVLAGSPNEPGINFRATSQMIQ